MVKLTQSLKAWGSPVFNEVVKQELEQLGASELPLQQGLSQSSVVSNSPYQVMIIDVAEDEYLLRVKVGIFYQGIIAGCSCADDPAPVDEQTEYCIVQCLIDRKTAEAAVTLVGDE